MEANKGPNAVQCYGVVSLLIKGYLNPPAPPGGPSIQTSVRSNCWGYFGGRFSPGAWSHRKCCGGGQGLAYHAEVQEVVELLVCAHRRHPLWLVHSPAATVGLQMASRGGLQWWMQGGAGTHRKNRGWERRDLTVAEADRWGAGELCKKPF